MKRILILAVALTAVFALQAAPASAQSVDECSISYHEPVTDGSVHMGVVHALCASDGPRRTASFGGCLQQALKGQQGASPWGNVACNSGSVAYGDGLPGEAFVLITVPCRSLSPVLGVPAGNGLFRTSNGNYNAAGTPGTTNSLPVPLACF